ncbi:TPA: hypothetical protein GE126_26170 [Escherichia coli]|nr:hypothetical protein [Escherichia coli]HAH4194512.1 hypothetical protein [Escherichia coli]
MPGVRSLKSGKHWQQKKCSTARRTLTGIFPLTVFCKNGDITNPELSGGKMPDAGRNMTWDLRAPAPTPSHLRATVAIKGSFRGAEF